MVGTERVDSIRHLRKYGSVFNPDVEEFETFNSKLNSYLSEFVTMNDERKSEFFFWLLRIPKLGKNAFRVFSIPPSNAASEKTWNILDFLHSKKRNRLECFRIKS